MKRKQPIDEDLLNTNQIFVRNLPYKGITEKVIL